MISLVDHVDRSLASPWEWGVLDCVHFAGDWVRTVTGRDPLGPYRGAYDSALGAARLIRDRGGLAAMVAAEMDRCGFARTTTPDHGDLGIIDMPQENLVGSKTGVMLLSGPWWQGLSPEGVVGVQIKPVVAWRVR